MQTFLLERPDDQRDHIPRVGQIQEHGISNLLHSESTRRNISVAHAHEAREPVLSKFLLSNLDPLLVEVEGVEVAGRGDGSDEGVGQGTAART